MQCLEIWRGLNPGPYLHSLHFSYSFGAFLAPLLAKPFLGVPASAPVAVNSTLSSNGDEQDTNQILSLDTAREEVPSKIGTLYPITGIVNFAICTGYLYLSCKEIVGYLQRGRGIEANPNEGLKKDRKDQEYFFGNQASNVIYNFIDTGTPFGLSCAIWEITSDWYLY